MRSIRLIARLDVKSPNLVKGIQLEGLRKIGDPNLFAKKYYDQGIDEIYYEDIVASLYDRNSIIDIIKKTTQDVLLDSLLFNMGQILYFDFNQIVSALTKYQYILKGVTSLKVRVKLFNQLCQKSKIYLVNKNCLVPCKKFIDPLGFSFLSN